VDHGRRSRWARVQGNFYWCYPLLTMYPWLSHYGNSALDTAFKMAVGRALPEVWKRLVKVYSFFKLKLMKRSSAHNITVQRRVFISYSAEDAPVIFALLGNHDVRP
jgi:hypothetical protein